MALSDTDYARATDSCPQPGDICEFLMGATKIYKGDVCLIKTDGYAYSSYETGATGDQFIGVAYETIDNSGGSAGDKKIRVWQTGIHTFEIASSTIATDLGLPVYNDRAVGPKTVTTTAGTHGCVVGNIVELLGTVTASTSCRVRITPMSAVAS